MYQIDSPVKPLGFDTEIGKCRNCWAHNLCGGGCYYDGFETTGNSYHTCNTNKCKIHRSQIKAAIYIYYHLKQRGLLDSFCNQLLLLQMRISLQYRVGNEVCNGIYFSCESICSWAS